MANSVQIIADTTKRYCVKLWGNAAETYTLKINTSKLNYALNANGIMMSTVAPNNYNPGTVTSDRLPCYALYLHKIIYDVKSGDTQGVVELRNDSDGAVNGNVIWTMGWSGSEEFTDSNWSASINCATGSNCTGNILINTTGFLGSNSAYSILLDFRKEQKHFSAGQQKDPTAFNQGPAKGFGS